VAIINFVALRAETGEEITGSRQVKMHLDTVEESPFMGLEKVGEAIQGMTVGETKQFNCKMPATWLEPESKDTDLIYEITVLEVLSWELPEMTDEVAKQLNSECSGVEDLTKRMAEAERMEANFEAMSLMREELCRQVAALVEVEVPDFYFGQMASNEYQRELLQSQAQGRLSREEVDQLATEEMLEKFIEAKRDSITETIKLTFGMAQIFKEQQLSVGEEMLKEGVESAQQEVAEMEGLNELDAERLKEQVKEELEGNVTMDWLIQNVDVKFTGSPDLQKVIDDVKAKKTLLPDS